MSRAPLRTLVGSDGRIVCHLAVVAVHEGETEHWEINPDGDLEVTVILHDQQRPVRALMGAGIGGPARGVFSIPPIGAEVLVAFEGRDDEGEAIIVAVLPTGDVPADLTPDRVLVVAPEVWVYDGTGAPEPLVRRSEFLAHKHALPALIGQAAYDTQDDPLAETGTPTATITGTPVLKG